LREEMLIPYPFSKSGLYIRILGTLLSTILSLYLLFNTLMIEFILSLLIVFPASYIFFIILNIFKTRRIISELEKKDRYIQSKRKGENYYKFFIRIMMLVIAPFIVILFSPVIGLGLILGVFCGHGFSEITHYAYVKGAERKLKGRIYHFTSMAGPDGYYYTGFRVVRLVED